MKALEDKITAISGEVLKNPKTGSKVTQEEY